MATTTKSTNSAKAGGFIKVTLTAGLAHKMDSHRKVVRALGLGKFGSSAVHFSSPTINGMVRKVCHLVTVEPCEKPPEKKK